MADRGREEEEEGVWESPSTGGDSSDGGSLDGGSSDGGSSDGGASDGGSSGSRSSSLSTSPSLLSSDDSREGSPVPLDEEAESFDQERHSPSCRPWRHAPLPIWHQLQQNRHRWCATLEQRQRLPNQVLWRVAPDAGEPAAIPRFGLNFSPDGRFLASSTESVTDIFVSHNQHVVARLPMASNTSRWCGDCRLLLGDDEGSVQLWDLRNPQQPELQLQGHRHSVKSIFVLNDQQTVLTCGFDDQLLLWNLQDSAVDGTLQPKRQGCLHEATRLTLSPSCEQLAFSLNLRQTFPFGVNVLCQIGHNRRALEDFVCRAEDLSMNLLHRTYMGSKPPRGLQTVSPSNR
ncbi:uncharacterized protein MONBRDRAFT_36620, partial [Monosiga brevicollis MX1]